MKVLLFFFLTVMRKTVSISGLSLGNEDQRFYQNHGTAVTMRGI